MRRKPHDIQCEDEAPKLAIGQPVPLSCRYCLSRKATLLALDGENAINSMLVRGATVGGIVGITVWQIFSTSLLGLGFTYGLAALVVHMGLCFILGMAIERMTLVHFHKCTDE